MADLYTNNVTAQQLGSPSGVGLYFVQRSDTLLVEDDPIVIQGVVLNLHFTLDHATNGILDSATLQLDTGLGTQTSHYSVGNPDNIWRWHFRHTQGSVNTFGQLATIGFTDTSTATEDVTTNYRVDFTAGQVWNSKPIYKDPQSSQKVSQVLVNLTKSGTFTIQASSNGGSNWTTVPENTLTDITASQQGYDLRLKITEAATASGWVSDILTEYTLV